MAQVAPAPAEGTEDATFVQVMPDGEATARVSSSRRKSLKPRFDGLSDAEKSLAFTLRALGQPITNFSLLTTLIVCTLLTLLVGVPYAANERVTDANPMLQTAVRGLIVGIWLYFIIGPMFLLNASTLVRGGFHLRFLLSLPLTLGPAVGVAFIPVDGSTLGIISVWFLTLGIGYVVCFLALSAPFFATDEHKALSASFGPPLVVIGLMFFGLISAHLTLT